MRFTLIFVIILLNCDVVLADKDPGINNAKQDNAEFDRAYWNYESDGFELERELVRANYENDNNIYGFIDLSCGVGSLRHQEGTQNARTSIPIKKEITRVKKQINSDSANWMINSKQ